MRAEIPKINARLKKKNLHDWFELEIQSFVVSQNCVINDINGKVLFSLGCGGAELCNSVDIFRNAET